MLYSALGFWGRLMSGTLINGGGRRVSCVCTMSGGEVTKSHLVIMLGSLCWCMLVQNYQFVILSENERLTILFLVKRLNPQGRGPPKWLWAPIFVQLPVLTNGEPMDTVVNASGLSNRFSSPFPNERPVRKGSHLLTPAPSHFLFSSLKVFFPPAQDSSGWFGQQWNLCFDPIKVRFISCYLWRVLGSCQSKTSPAFPRSGPPDAALPARTWAERTERRLPSLNKKDALAFAASWKWVSHAV